MVKDYSSGKIYTIKCISDSAQVYVGSTRETLLKRLVNHKHKYASKTVKSLLYDAVRLDPLGWCNWKIDLVKCFECSTKTELNNEEGNIMTELKANLNIRKAGSTREETIKNYNNKIQQTPEYKTYQKEYREKNKEKNKEKRLNKK